MLTFRNGTIEKIRLNGCAVPLRADEYAPALTVTENGVERDLIFSRDGDRFTANACGGKIFVRALERDEKIEVCVTVEAGENSFAPERLSLRTGVDCYMASYPEWNEQFYPTWTRCEKTHVWGYFRRTDGLSLAFCGDATASWRNHYNRVYYDPENFDDPGHRIYTQTFDLMSALPQPPRHPKITALAPNEKREWRFAFSLCSSDDELYAFYEREVGLEPLRLKKWTLESGEKIEFDGDFSGYEIELTAPSGEKVDLTAPLAALGGYALTYKAAGKVAEANVYVRASSDFYLEAAAKSALAREQFAASNCECYYGFFPLFGYLARVKDEKIEAEAVARLDKFLSVILNDERDGFKDLANPERVQNLTTVVSILTLAHKATGMARYLTIAKKLADRVIEAQRDDGAYYSRGVHYTCVIYPAKSLVELSDELYRAGEDGGKYLRSARLAAENLRLLKTNIGTEGEHTFEDGMITCEALQLALMGLKTPDERDSYVAAAKEVLDEHRCLELRHIPDARSRGCTLRHWEAHYDVLTSRNMTTAPHGWTSWKTYAEYYLYLLTNESDYLRRAFDSLGACMQTTNVETGEISWAFAIDPCVDANVFERGDGESEWRLTPKVFGETYVPMISSWWRANTDVISTGYGDPRINRTVGRDYGACCDSDVYEHYKCLGEIGFTALVHIEGGETLAYNCKTDGKTIFPSCSIVSEARIYSDRDVAIDVFGRSVDVKAGCAVRVSRD